MTRNALLCSLLAGGTALLLACGGDNGGTGAPQDASPGSDGTVPTGDAGGGDAQPPPGDAAGGNDATTDAPGDDAGDGAADAQLDAGAEAGPATQPTGTHFLDAGGLLGSTPDPGWYLDNIPLFEAPDTQIQTIYYYRWASYKEHLDYTGSIYGYVLTEFLFPSSYGAPYGGVVAAAGHHIAEGRWLRSQRYVKDDIRYWMGGPGQFPKLATDSVNADTNDWAHEYSFWAASSVWGQYLVSGDQSFVALQQPALIAQYQGWQNHYDSTLGLYWQVPVWDATEYSPSSYESSDPYHGGAGFRPTINAYQYGDARAIASIARLTGDTATATTYDGLAGALATNLQAHVWDANRTFFYDVPRDNNAGRTLLDTREEMGFVPWMFDMPPAADAVQFQQLLDPQGFQATYGPTTTERRSTMWFMYQAASGCCRWDGPSWPYETVQVLKGVANLLNDYPAQAVITPADYVNLLHTYAVTQFESGSPHLGQAHDPDNDSWMYEGDDYNHSTFNDNVIGELVGIRPQPDDTVVVNPLAPATWDYFALENLLYHGHELTVLWDRTGARYGQGAGLHVYVDGAPAASQATLGSVKVSVGAAVAQSDRLAGVDVAANTQKYGYGPQPFASYTWPNDSVWNAIDGLNFRVGISEGTRWTTYSTTNPTDYFGVNFLRNVTVDDVKLYFYDDGGGVRVPASYDLQYWTNNAWVTVPGQTRTATAANGETDISFPPITTIQVRVVAPNAGNKVGWGLSEFIARSKPIFHVVNVNSNLLLAVQNASQTDGALVQQYHDSGTPDHLWELVPVGSGTYKIMNVNSGLVLAPAGNSTAPNTQIVQTADGASPFAQWSLVDDVYDSHSGQFKVRNVGSKLLLAVTAASTTDSANVIQVADAVSTDRLWTFQPAETPQYSYDDFEDASTAQWTVATGSWAVCSPVTKEYCASTAAPSVSLTGQVAWRDYTVEAKLRPDPVTPGVDVGLVARAADATHFYSAELTRGTGGIEGWSIAKNDGGVVTVLASGTFAWGSLAATGQMTVRLGAAGGYLSLGIIRANGDVQTLGEAVDVSFGAGMAGVKAGGAGASFDEVRVTGG